MSELFVARKLVAVWLGTERVAARSTRGAESDSACDHCTFLDIFKELGRPTRGKRPPCGDLAERGAETRLEEVVHY